MPTATAPRQQLHQANRKSTQAPTSKRATSENDWLIQELAEGKPLARSGDSINDAVARHMYVLNDSRTEWRGPRSGQRFNVTRHYFHAPALVIDKPRQGDLTTPADKAAYFAGTEITYVAIAPGESLTPEELRDRVRQGLRETAARMKPVQTATQSAPKAPQVPAKAVKAPSKPIPKAAKPKGKKPAAKRRKK